MAERVLVNSEATDKDYGKLQILQLPSDTQVGGPSQIANQFSSDRGVTQALLQFRQSDAKVQNGNLLTLPVGGGLLYVQPVYIRRQAAEGTYPVLQFVAASFGKERPVAVCSDISCWSQNRRAVTVLSGPAS